MKRTMILVILAALLASAFGGASVTPVLALDNGVDLAPTALVVVSTVYEGDTSVEVDLTFVNRGDTASDDFKVNFAVRLVNASVDIETCGNSDYEHQITTSIAGSVSNDFVSVTQNIPIPVAALSAGVHKITVWLDSDCEVDETNEGNNVLEYQFVALKAGVDLAPTEIFTSASYETALLNEFYANDDVGISVTVDNVGDTAAENYTIHFAIHPVGESVGTSCPVTPGDWDYFVASASLESSTTDRLARQTWDITVPAGDLVVGDYRITVFVDSGCAVGEVDEVDNVLTYDFSIVALDPEFDVPENDNFADATDLGSLSLPFSTGVIDTRGATREASDPSELHCRPTTDALDAGLATVWYTYTPDEDQTLVLDTDGSDYDTYLAVFKDGAPLEFVDCNDDVNPAAQPTALIHSSLPIKLQGGVKYYFLVGQFVVLGNSDGIQAQAGSTTFKFNISEGREISGNAGEPNVTLTYSNNFSQTVTSGADGKYTIVVPNGWSGTVTPSKTGVVFLPSQRTYTNVTTDLTSENYTARQTYYSVGKQDGWVLESGEFTNKGGKLNKGAKVLNVGDDALNRQYRSILSFNTSNLPDTAAVSKVTLRVRRQGSAGGGNPITMFGGFMVDIKKGNFGTAGLQLADFSTKGNKTIGTFKPKLVGGWYTINLTKGKVGINKAGNTQIRLRFKLDDNNNSVANFLKLYSGNAPLASRPQLIIEYSMPISIP